MSEQQASTTRERRALANIRAFTGKRTDRPTRTSNGVLVRCDRVLWHVSTDGEVSYFSDGGWARMWGLDASAWPTRPTIPLRTGRWRDI